MKKDFERREGKEPRNTTPPPPPPSPTPDGEISKSMTDKKHTPEPWKVNGSMGIWDVYASDGRLVAAVYPSDHDLEEIRKANAARIVECVNALAGIDNPAEWVEKMKRIASYIKLGDNFYGIDIADILEANHNLEAKRVELQAENERLKKEVKSWQKASEHFRTNEVAALIDIMHNMEENEALQAENERLREQLGKMGGLSSSERGFCRICGGDSCDSDSHK